MLQSADLIFDPNGASPVRLMLLRNRNGGRAWRRARPSRKLLASPNEAVEGSLVWTSWHLGDGYSRIGGTGSMLPVTSEGPADALHPGMLRLPPKVQAFTSLGNHQSAGMAEFSDKFWSYGRDTVTRTIHIVRIDPTSNAVDQSWDTTVSLSPATFRKFGHAVQFGTRLYFGIEMNLGGTYSTTGSLPGSAHSTLEWATAVVSAGKLFFGGGHSASGNQFVIRSVAQGAAFETVANHSAPVFTAETTWRAPITKVAAIGRVVYLGTVEGLRALDGDLNLFDPIPDLRNYAALENCQGMASWHGGLLIPHVRGVFYYNEGVVAPVGIDRTRINGTTILGQVTWIVADGEYFWATMQTATDVILLRGRERSDDEPVPTPVIWQEVYRTASTGILVDISDYPREMTVTALPAGPANPTPRLLWSKNGTPSYINLPPRGAAPATLTSDFGPFELSGHKNLPTVNMDQPMVTKYLKSVEVDAEGLDTNKTVAVSYALNPTSASPTFTSLGTANTVGRTELSFPTNTSCRSVQLRVALATNSDTATPVLLRLALNYTTRPLKNNVWTARARLGPGVVDREGNEVLEDGDTTVNRLLAYEDGNAVTMIDPNGNTINVLVLDVTEEEEEQQDDQSSIRIVTLLLEKVI